MAAAAAALTHQHTMTGAPTTPSHSPAQAGAAPTLPRGPRATGLPDPVNVLREQQPDTKAAAQRGGSALGEMMDRPVACALIPTAGEAPPRRVRIAAASAAAAGGPRDGGGADRPAGTPGDATLSGRKINQEAARRPGPFASSRGGPAGAAKIAAAYRVRHRRGRPPPRWGGRSLPTTAAPAPL
ncbi:translation initiation factor IF-2-like [Schistocerca gregaria]|uniref:translation initiation factor IF-2-like n=1 Tax=Schistocerca gregaria TaxID=7010 RepID=UPI00211ED69F|nr:translation initiation factor IF-2-like [Schistocerca gregaria]